jgi:excisionase family DNA binding protein
MLLTKDEVATMLRISLRTLDRLRLLGFLPCVRLRGCVRFTEEDVQKCVDELRKHGLQSWRDE